MAKLINKVLTTKKTFNCKTETLNKLVEIRNYHNKTFDKVFELFVENAYLSMSEITQEKTAEKLIADNKMFAFQVQQLTLLFSQLKEENTNLKAESDKIRKDFDDHLKRYSAFTKANNDFVNSNKTKLETIETDIKIIQNKKWF